MSDSSSQPPEYGAPGGAQPAQGGNYPPPAQGGNYPPPAQGGYYPASEQPPKKKHTLRNVILGIVLVCILAFVGCTALLVGGVNKAVNDSVNKDNQPGGSANPLKVTEGKSFAVGKWKAEQGWAVKSEAILHDYTVNINVTNTSTGSDTVFFTMKLLSGSRVVASIDCNTGKLEPGQTQQANCLSVGNSRVKYKSITVENTF